MISLMVRPDARFGHPSQCNLIAFVLGRAFPGVKVDFSGFDSLRLCRGVADLACDQTPPGIAWADDGHP